MKLLIGLLITFISFSTFAVPDCNKSEDALKAAAKWIGADKVESYSWLIEHGNGKEFVIRFVTIENLNGRRVAVFSDISVHKVDCFAGGASIFLERYKK
ncbi:MAG: hypothetical protein AB7I27_14850 [Bacteriovoracaceae bacterium]